MTSQTFDRMPPMGQAWLRALRGKPGLAPGGTVPRIEARVAVAHADPRWVGRFGRVTGTAIEGRLPATAPQALALPVQMAVLTAPEFPLPLLGAVHVRQRIDVLAPIPLDGRMTIDCSVEGARHARRGVEVDLITEIDVHGKPAWRAVTTFLSRGKGAPGEGKGGADQARGATSEGGAEAAAPSGSDAVVPPADPSVSAIWRLPEDLGRRFAAVAGDRNPIHIHALTARPFGFKQPIIHGMWTLARSLASLDLASPTAPTRIECRFLKPLPLPGSARLVGWRDGDVSTFQVFDGKGRLALVGSVALLPQGG